MSRFKLAIAISTITLLSAGVVWVANSRATSDSSGLADTTPQGPGLERYVDSLDSFFFDYPAGLKLTVTDNGEDHTIFGDTPAGETRLMIVASPYLLHEPLSEEGIRAQPFAADITSPIERITLPDGTTAFLFRRTDTPLGPTRDAFIVHGETIYQVSVAASFENALTHILESWRFGSSSAL